MPDAPRQLIADRYRLVRPLGQGGMGRVWQARDEMLQRDVAIKELVAPPGLRDDERREMRERSMREARAVARLGHVNVVRVFDVLHSGDDPWIVMELVPSRSLHEVLEAEGPMPVAHAARIGLGVLGALRAAHQAGVLHRDVKPANVLLAHDGRVVLTDFGLATLPGDPRMTQTGMVLGSPAYLAPERATDGEVGPAADLWSLGATLYAAVEGRTPYHRSSPIATLAALATEPPPPAQRAGRLTPLLEGLLRRDPGQRISVEEADRLLRYAAAQVDPVDAAGPPAAASGPAVPFTRINTGDGTPRSIVPEFVTAGSGRPVDPSTDPSASATSPPPAATSDSLSVPTSSNAESAADSEAGPTSGPARRRRGWLVGSVAAAVMVVLVVSASMLSGRPSGEANGAAAPTADPSSVADEAVSQVLPPPSAGWRYHRDDPRFLVPVPDGWRSQRVGEGVEFREPGGSRQFVLDELRSVPADLVAGLRTREKAERERYASYRRVRLAALKYQVRAAEWEWTYTDADGTPMRASSRAFVDRNGHAYTIGWTTSDAEWSVSRGIFELVTDGFQGLPLPAGPPSGSPSAPAGGAGRPSAGPGSGSTAGAGQPSATAAPPPSAPVRPAGTKQIVTKETGLCLSSGERDGVRVTVRKCQEVRNQWWTFSFDGTIRANGFCLDVAWGEKRDGVAVQSANCTAGAAQKWEWIEKDGRRSLFNRLTDKCVDVDGHAAGAPLMIWTCVFNAKQTLSQK
ncbi:serine/threonine protein kinase [Micromonospora sp. NPDC047527]|uniref:serine/threonine protein kinase n=1 Tax=Micromonospora sp. NPDC047527 TaxID=3155144 RepID=UPI00340CF69D